jgi:hypothetical protein
MTVVKLPDHLIPAGEVLQSAYPDGLPKGAYSPLLVALSEDMSEENLSILIADFVNGESVIVANDAAAALSVRRPSPSDVQQVAELLARHGWVADEFHT